MNRFQFLTAAILVCLPYMYCSHSPSIAGGTGEETTNGITACAIRADGTPAAGAFVRLRRSDYVASIPALAKTAIYGADALTDSSGRFKITGIDPGSYRIEVTDGHAAVLLACSLDVRDTLDLGVDTLRAFATIAGTVDTAGRAGQRAYVQVEGLARLAAVDDAGRFVLNDLPAGSFTVRTVTAQDTAIASASGISVGPGAQTTVKIQSGWRFSKRLYLNTTATGANVAEDVTGFPLLIRLDATNFDFTQARDSGQDLRFTKADGSMLPYEIEFWEAAARKAALWVRTDTVLGNSSSQFIVMQWGNSSAASASNGALVFDSADGCAGVWYLETDPANDAPNAITDQTAYARHGTTAGAMTAAARFGGAIGNCFLFDGTDDQILVGNWGKLSFSFANITLSAWIKTGSARDQGIISVAGRQRPDRFRLRMEVGENGKVWIGVSDSTQPSGWITAPGRTTVCDNKWHHIAGVFERSGLARLYIDGRADTTVDISSRALLPLDSADITIGYDDWDSLSFFAGYIDEARIFDRAMPETFIRLMYANQNVSDFLIRRRD